MVMFPRERYSIFHLILIDGAHLLKLLPKYANNDSFLLIFYVRMYLHAQNKPTDTPEYQFLVAQLDLFGKLCKVHDKSFF